MVVAGLQALPTRNESMEEAARLLYVAMTRATQDLVLSAHGSSPIMSRVKNSLGEVARQFAATSTSGWLKRWLGRVGLRNDSS